MKIIRKQFDLSKERGVAIVFFVLVLSIVLLLFGVFGSIGMHLVIESQLQSAADAASLAGSAAIAGYGDNISRYPGALPQQIRCPSGYCSARQRWHDAREMAVLMLKSSSAYGNFGKSSNILPPDAVPIEATGDTPPMWRPNDYNTEVTIERGRWINSPNLNDRFESFEGDWQDSNPGIPNFMAFNAVRVTLKRTTVDVPFFSSLVNQRLSAHAKSTSVVRLPEPVSVPPLAIHVCALLNGELGADYVPSYGCLADKLFTSTKRHCPEEVGPNCGNIPQFSWDPILISDNWSYWDDLETYPMEISARPHSDRACFWSSPRYLEAGDNYGIIGMPGDEDISDESEANILTNLINGSNASIGGSFYVFENGFSLKDSEDKIWARITGSSIDNLLFRNTDLVNAPGTDTTAGSTSPNVNTNNAYRIDRTSCKPTTSLNQWPEDFYSHKPIDWSGEIGGTCNSKRSNWGHWSEFTSSLYTSRITKGNLWRPLVAVIAERGPSAEACKGMSLGDTGETNINPDPSIHRGPYEIIGFVRVNIFDVDISHLPPSFPPSNVLGYSNAVPDNDPDVLDKVEYPWGFSDPQGTPIPCNLIRSRLACDQNPVPAAQGGGATQPDPVLVPDEE